MSSKYFGYPGSIIILYLYFKTVAEIPGLLHDNFFWVVNVSSEESFMREMEAGHTDLPINSNIFIVSGKINSTLRLSECFRPHPKLNVRSELKTITANRYVTDNMNIF